MQASEESHPTGPKTPSSKWQPKQLTDKALFPEAIRVAVALMVLSFVLCGISRVLEWKRKLEPKNRELLGKIIVILWIVGPPIWFWIEWSLCSTGLSGVDKEDLKHSQELSRNLWVAIVFSLAACFGVPPFHE